MEELTWWLRPMFRFSTRQSFARSSVPTAGALMVWDVSSFTTLLKFRTLKFVRLRRSRVLKTTSRLLSRSNNLLLSHNRSQWKLQSSLQKLANPQTKMMSRLWKLMTQSKINVKTPKLNKKRKRLLLSTVWSHLCLRWTWQQQHHQTPIKQKDANPNVKQKKLTK